MTSKLVDRFKILKKFKTGSVVIHKESGSLEVVADIGLTGETVSLELINSPLGHIINLKELLEDYIPATPLAQTLYGIKGKKTY